MYLILNGDWGTIKCGFSFVLTHIVLKPLYYYILASFNSEKINLDRAKADKSSICKFL